MPQSQIYLAADLGAGSGRVIAAHFDGETIELQEISRFANEPILINGSIHWDITGLYRNISAGFSKALTQWPDQIVSAGIDTWGVDYGLIDDQGSLLGIPYAYRDSRTNGMVEAVGNTIAAEDLYTATGIQTAFFNTLYQLAASRKAGQKCLLDAHRLLFIPDLLNFWLTGVAANERTIVSTSQLYDPNTRQWAWGIIGKLGLPADIFGEIVDPGVALGTARLAGRDLKIVTVGSHDTASAVAAVPARNSNAAYLSSGTWSLLGIESDKPILSKSARAANFTNETGVGDKIRFLKNITGLWLIQECRAAWDKDGHGEIRYEDLTTEAEAAQAFKAFLDPDSKDFVAPGNMPSRIGSYVEKAGQPALNNRGELTRSIFESLALKYAVVMESLEEITELKVSELNVVGGGCRDRLLNQFTANALQRPVVAGPAEATATGNILAQMMASGSIANLEEGREIVRRSFETTVFEPAESTRWEDALASYKTFLHDNNKA